MQRTWIKTFVSDIADKWQIPVFILALIVCGTAVHTLVTRQQHLGTEQYIANCQKLLDRHDYRETLSLADDIYAELELNEDQQRRMQGIVARALHGIETSRDHHSEKALARIERDLKASAHDRPFTVEEQLILADVYEYQGKYRTAIDYLQLVLDDGYGDRVEILRRILELLPRTHLSDKAARFEATLDKLLAEPDLHGADLAWAVSEKAELLFAKDRFADAVALIREALPKIDDPDHRKRLAYELAFGEYSRGNLDDAERSVRVLLGTLTERTELAARASLLLADICAADDRPEEAYAIYEGLANQYGHSQYHAAALVGQAEVLATLGRLEASQLAYQQAFTLLGQIGPHKLIDRRRIIDSIDRVATEFSEDKRWHDALAFAHLQYEYMDPDDTPNCIAVLLHIANWHVKEAERREQRREKVVSPDLAAELDHRIADDYLLAAEHFEKLAAQQGVLDRFVADALWEAARCYRKAGKPENATATLEKFVEYWPNDPHLPQALFMLARGYQDIGRCDDAAHYYRRIIAEFQRTPQGQASLVPLAQCYMAMGPDNYDLAERVLRGIVDDTSNQELFNPESVEFRQALFKLGKLNYLQKRYEQCAARLEEALDRYPDDREVPEGRFLMAQSYRQLAEKYRKQIDQTNDRTLKTQLARNWKVNLERARELYIEATDALDNLSDRSDLENTYLRLACIYNADCLFDLSQYSQAIRAYETVVDRYGQSELALGAYLQIINSYQRLGQWGKIKAVLERMKWLVQQLPEQAFNGADSVMSRSDWADWIDWNYRSGMLDYQPVRQAEANSNL